MLWVMPIMLEITIIQLTKVIEEYKIVQYNYLFGGMNRLDDYYTVKREETT